MTDAQLLELAGHLTDGEWGFCYGDDRMSAREVGRVEAIAHDEGYTLFSAETMYDALEGLCYKLAYAWWAWWKESAFEAEEATPHAP